MGQTASITSTALGAFSKIRGSQIQAGSLNAAATSLNQEAGQSVASGIQGLINERQRTSYVVSSAIARGAGSGGVATSESALMNQSRIQAAGDYRGLTQLYQGEDRAAELRARAQGYGREADATEASGWISGMSNVLKGADSFFTKYGMPTFPKPGSTGGGGVPSGGYDPSIDAATSAAVT